MDVHGGLEQSCMCMEAWSSRGYVWRLGVVMDVKEAWSSHGCAWRLLVLIVCKLCVGRNRGKKETDIDPWRRISCVFYTFTCVLHIYMCFFCVFFCAASLLH